MPVKIIFYEGSSPIFNNLTCRKIARASKFEVSKMVRAFRILGELKRIVHAILYFTLNTNSA